MAIILKHSFIMPRNKRPSRFRMPYGSIALGGVFAMVAGFFVSHNGVLMFLVGMAVVVLSLTLAFCRILGKPGGFWPWL